VEQTPNNKEGSKVCIELENDRCFVSGKGVIVVEAMRMEDDATNKRSSLTRF
jgi:hypothetical protein